MKLLVYLFICIILASLVSSANFNISEHTDYRIADNTIYVKVCDNLGKAQNINISSVFKDDPLTNQISFNDIYMNQSYQFNVITQGNISIGKYSKSNISLDCTTITGNSTNTTTCVNITHYYLSNNTEMFCDNVLADKTCNIIGDVSIRNETRYDYLYFPTLKQKIVVSGLKIEQKSGGIPLPKDGCVDLRYTYNHPMTKPSPEINKYDIIAIGDDGNFTTLDPTWFNASGGTITTIIDINDGLNYTVHTFTSNGTFETAGAGSITNVSVLVVAGGGGGAGENSNGAGGGGGGAGGLLYNATLLLANGSYTVIVGYGGTRGNGRATLATKGGSSNFSGMNAIGGGYGAPYSASSYAGNGGSGGGGGTGGRWGNGTAGQGYRGGNGSACVDCGAGGGASAVGGNSACPGVGGSGGAGLNYSINGTNQYYAGGGGAGANSAPFDTSNGGIGGGGNGAVSPQNGTNGLGGGGGGKTYGASTLGGNGGSGVVIIRYLTSTGGGPTNSCTYSGTGNWAINCSDSCNLTATNMNRLNFTIIGATANQAGVYGFRNISNYTFGRIENCMVRA